MYVMQYLQVRSTLASVLHFTDSPTAGATFMYLYLRFYKRTKGGLCSQIRLVFGICVSCWFVSSVGIVRTCNNYPVLRFTLSFLSDQSVVA
jgi:hypothetical protein